MPSAVRSAGSPDGRLPNSAGLRHAPKSSDLAVLKWEPPGRLNPTMKCPRCASTRVYPSRLRNAWERLRQKVTDRQPYRCHEFSWRRWRDVEFLTANPDVKPDDLRTHGGGDEVSQTDVDQL